ncbi:hypothetical protein EVB55_094 [Rhizobium phage RHph_Y68]|uniref:Uncharacterized protein n=1 Tax=Rhizobium phage RHph_Y68 TaxID=2509787 RepID=A0A7S5R945_9CAUD|nr:hypothetical protein PP934_gp094 [Rhizobium phage RHph_Y68]QIG68029.1 hypothetical protein EVB55_094 [Rhizobium phage RHph_Y68]
MRTYKPDSTYTSTMEAAVKALAEDKDDLALELANKAMNFALYKMMEPLDSIYVKRAVGIRNAVFTVRRYDQFVAAQ